MIEELPADFFDQPDIPGIYLPIVGDWMGDEIVCPAYIILLHQQTGKMYPMPKQCWQWNCRKCATERVQQLLMHLDRVMGGEVWIGIFKSQDLPSRPERGGGATLQTLRACTRKTEVAGWLWIRGLDVFYVIATAPVQTKHLVHESRWNHSDALEWCRDTPLRLPVAGDSGQTRYWLFGEWRDGAREISPGWWRRILRMIGEEEVKWLRQIYEPGPSYVVNRARLRMLHEEWEKSHG